MPRAKSLGISDTTATLLGHTARPLSVASSILQSSIDKFNFVLQNLNKFKSACDNMSLFVNQIFESVTGSKEALRN
jgi:hypothetical protein